MNITPYAPHLRRSFEEMLVAYFVHDLNSDIPEEIVRGKLMDLITGQLQDGTYHLAIALEAEGPMGFSIYQIDTPGSDWCKRPGWGFIREFYIKKEYRKQGFGRTLAEFTEAELRSLGAERLYLTADPAVIPFWESCGWKNTPEICTNDLNILVK